LDELPPRYLAHAFTSVFGKHELIVLQDWDGVWRGAFLGLHRSGRKDGLTDAGPGWYVVGPLALGLVAEYGVFGDCDGVALYTDLLRGVSGRTSETKARANTEILSQNRLRMTASMKWVQHPEKPGPVEETTRCGRELPR
jgi:hypothetical protein